MTLPTTTTRNLTLPNATTSFGGTYEVEVRSGNCQVIAKTEVAVRACEDLYIKSYVPSTGEQTTQLKRKAGVVPMAYESLELSVETLDGQRLPGAAYSWSGPVGVSLPLDASKPFLTQTNQVGKYKATVSFGEGDVCVLETNLSGKPCQVFTDGDCNNTPVGVNANAEPNENIRNLAVGDVFNVGDYEVTVTKLTSGSQAQGWTGEGMVDQNLIARIKIPMTVEFKKIKINACYQYYNRGENGAYVKSKFDESWGSVAGTNSNDLGKNHAQEVATRLSSLVDILGIFECSTSQRAELTRLLGELEILSSQAQGNLDYSDAQKALLKEGVLEVKTLVNGLLSCCVASSPNGRVAAGTCEPTSTIQAKTQTRISQLQNFPKPSFSPYVIAKSRHRKGMNDEGTGPHHDMMSCDMTDQQIIDLNPLAAVQLNFGTVQSLVNNWKLMASPMSMGNLHGVAMEMIDKFVGGWEGPFRNAKLDAAAANHASTSRFFDRIKESLEYELLLNSNFIFSKRVLKYIVDGKESNLRSDIPSPLWNDWFTGLGIMINDTWGYDATIKNFAIDKEKRTYSATIEVVVFDHFGLDRNDIDPKIKPEFALLAGFRSWFVLQHSTRFCKKPFVTLVHLNRTIHGTY